MEFKVYKVVVGASYDDIDIDNCTTLKDVVVFNDLLASRKEAIRLAQRKFDRQPLNDYVHMVWARVYPVIISDKKSNCGKRIYNKFKSNN